MNKHKLEIFFISIAGFMLYLEWFHSKAIDLFWNTFLPQIGADKIFQYAVGNIIAGLLGGISITRIFRKAKK